MSIRQFFAKCRWRYVGVVHGYSHFVDDNGNRTEGGERHGYWILTENGFGSRRCKERGNCGHSPLAQRRKAEVSAWLRGGPLPPLHNDFALAKGEKKSADLVVFPGGKGGAA